MSSFSFQTNLFKLQYAYKSTHPDNFAIHDSSMVTILTSNQMHQTTIYNFCRNHFNLAQYYQPETFLFDYIISLVRTFTLCFISHQLQKRFPLDILSLVKIIFLRFRITSQVKSFFFDFILYHLSKSFSLSITSHISSRYTIILMQ